MKNIRACILYVVIETVVSLPQLRNINNDTEIVVFQTRSCETEFLQRNNAEKVFRVVENDRDTVTNRIYVLTGRTNMAV